MAKKNHAITKMSSTDLALALAEQYEDSIVNLTADDSKKRRSLFHRESNDWPEVGIRSDLATFATNRQAYCAFLGFIANGARVTTAARSIGILQKKVQMWLKKGVTHLSSDRPNTCYAWFYLDCFQARGSSLVKAEMAAYQEDPIGFVKRMDAGGQFNDLDPIGAEALFRVMENDLTDRDDDDNDGTGQDVYEMLTALSEKHALNLESMVDQAREQIPENVKNQYDQGRDPS